MRHSVRFSQRFKELRKEKKITQAQIAEKIEVSRGSISFYELGSRMPDIDILYNMCQFLGCSADYLIGLTDFKGDSEKQNYDINCEKLSSLIGDLPDKSNRDNAINDILQVTKSYKTASYDTKMLLTYRQYLNTIVCGMEALVKCAKLGTAISNSKTYKATEKDKAIRELLGLMERAYCSIIQQASSMREFCEKTVINTNTSLEAQKYDCQFCSGINKLLDEWMGERSNGQHNKEGQYL